MCGIVYIRRKDDRPAYKAVLKRYRKQKNRGSLGYGYVAIRDNEVVSYQRAETEHEIIKLIEKETAPEILFHHRMPTSTPNITEANHPIIVEGKTLSHSYVGVHNGVIRNHKELKKKHDAAGFVYNTTLAPSYIASNGKTYFSGEPDIYNDSESVMVEAALALDGKKNSIETEGSAAVIILQTSGKRVLNRFLFRNLGNPLMFSEGKEILEITSSGHGTIIPSDKVYRLLPKGGYEAVGTLTPPPTYISSYLPSRTSSYPAYDASWDGARKVFDQTPARGLIEGLVRVRVIGFHPQDDDIDDGRQMDELIADLERSMEESDGAFLNFTYQDLWDEWQKSDEGVKLMKVQIRELDDKVQAGTMSEDVLVQRENLQLTLDDAERYCNRLAAELQVREETNEHLVK